MSFGTFRSNVIQKDIVVNLLSIATDLAFTIANTMLKPLKILAVTTRLEVSGNILGY